MPNPNSLVARLRREKKLTLEQFAKATGLNSAALSRIENGHRISAEQAITFSKFFKRPLEDFYPKAAGVLTKAACQ